MRIDSNSGQAPFALPALSVVICVRNGADVLPAQLDALAAQDATFRWEVVVVDNASTDTTAQVVTERATAFPVPLRLVSASERASIPYARNTGAKAAQGARIAWCDADDRVAPGWVQAAHDALDRFDLVAGINRVLTSPFNPDSAILNPEGVHTSQMGVVAQNCNAAVRRDVFLRVGGFDEALPAYGMEDTEFSYRLARRGGTIGAAPDMVVYFRETTATRVVLRKVAQSAMAELLVWYRFYDEFAHRLPLTNLVREAVGLVPEQVGRIRRGEALPPKTLVREAINRGARITAHLRWVRHGDVPPPELLTPADDPLAAPQSEAHVSTRATGDGFSEGRKQS